MSQQPAELRVPHLRGDVLPAAMWKELLSNIAVAEQAAAEHFAMFAEEFAALGNQQASHRYREFAQEEREHHRRVLQASRGPVATWARYRELMLGRRALAENPLVERMAVAHFAHETAALAFFGHIYAHVHKYMDDADWASELRELCAGILREEVWHVGDGKQYVAQLLEGASDAFKTQVRSALDIHRLFTIQMVRRSFRGAGPHPFVEGMLASYDQHCQTAAADIL